jgi:amidase
MGTAAGFHLQEATIDRIHGAYRAGKLSCADLVELYFDRVDAFDKRGPAVNAVQTCNENAVREARRLDARLAESGPVGPLHGIPVLVKDQVETEEMPTTYGSDLFCDYRPGRNATIVQKLKAAGAVIIAKTTMGEFAQGYAGSAFGACRNPYDPTRNPSGSSCGSGAGVAANFGTVGIGEDTGGSVRGPAACGSLVGLRPTVPLVSRAGMMPAVPTRDTLGPITRSVRDAAVLLDVISGYDPSDPMTAACVGHVPASYTSFLVPDALRGMRLGVIRDHIANDTNSDAEDYREIRAVIGWALGDLSNHGAEIVDPVPLPSLVELMRRLSGNASYETETAMNQYLADLPGSPIKSFQEIVLSSRVLPYRRTRLLESVGRTTSDAGYLTELLLREQLRQALLKAMADHHLDALVYATFDHLPTPIPEDIMSRTKNPNTPGNNRQLSPLVGFPAITVPAGFSADGLPIGIEFLGRPFTEGTLLRIAHGYEQATHHRRPPSTTPPLLGEP